MKAVFDEHQWKHDLKHFMVSGALEPNLANALQGFIDA